jgi:hypothetical protein
MAQRKTRATLDHAAHACDACRGHSAALGHAAHACDACCGHSATMHAMHAVATVRSGHVPGLTPLTPYINQTVNNN